MEFNEKLQELRKRRGLTQEALAEALFVSRTAVSKWESGRGYPSIDSLREIAKFFSVTVDELLSGEELLSAAEEDKRKTETRFRTLVFALLDISPAMLFFLPFFGQKSDGVIQSVSLMELTGVSLYLRIWYFIAVAGGVLWGLLTLILQSFPAVLSDERKIVLSLLLNAGGVLLFIISSQPYAAAFLFVLLMIKVLILAKKE